MRKRAYMGHRNALEGEQQMTTRTALVFYRHLNDEQTAQLNREGWSSDIGRAYLNARDGKYADAQKLGLMQPAARLEAEHAEMVWVLLQNTDKAWSAQTDIECLTTFPRSMDVGDVIVWNDGAMERCASIGFEPARDFQMEAK